MSGSSHEGSRALRTGRSGCGRGGRLLREEKGWVAYYFAATKKEAPVALADSANGRVCVRWCSGPFGIELPVVYQHGPAAAAAAAAAPLAGGEVAAGELNKLKASDLKAELKKRGLLVRGKKAELVERLEKALAEDDEEAGEVEEEVE
jgi:hypothetical protein